MASNHFTAEEVIYSYMRKGGDAKFVDTKSLPTKERMLRPKLIVPNVMSTYVMGNALKHIYHTLSKYYYN